MVINLAYICVELGFFGCEKSMHVVAFHGDSSSSYTLAYLWIIVFKVLVFEKSTS